MRKMGIWREYLIEKFTDRERAIGYLQAILEDYQIFGDSAVVLRALQTVVEAQGGVSELAKQAYMDPQLLSKMLSNEDTPLIDALGIVLKAFGYQLSIKPIETENSNLETYSDALEGQNTSAHVAENPID
jgi:DNA-binding phage protein